MDEEVFSPPFYNHYVSLRQLGNPNRVLRLYALMRKAREQLALFQVYPLEGNHIQPVGFYLCPSERESLWKVFLQMINYWTVFLHMIKQLGWSANG